MTSIDRATRAALNKANQGILDAEAIRQEANKMLQEVIDFDTIWVPVMVEARTRLKAAEDRLEAAELLFQEVQANENSGPLSTRHAMVERTEAMIEVEKIKATMPKPPRDGLEEKRNRALEMLKQADVANEKCFSEIYDAMFMRSSLRTQ